MVTYEPSRLAGVREIGEQPKKKKSETRWRFPVRIDRQSVTDDDMIADGQVVGDGSWELRVIVTDLSVERCLRVKGDLHIGGVMLRLVEELGTSLVSPSFFFSPIFEIDVDPLVLAEIDSLPTAGCWILTR